MRHVKTLNLDDDVIGWLKDKSNASDFANQVLMREMEREKGMPAAPKNPYPPYSPRKSCEYVEERMKQLRSCTERRLCELMTAEQGLSSKKTSQLVYILDSLGRITSTVKDGQRCLISLWSMKNNMYLSKEEARKMNPSLFNIEEDDGEIDSVLDAKVGQ